MNVEIKNCPIEVANDIWNEAIEEAAKTLEDILNKGSTYPGRLGPELIRKLKK